MTMRHPAITLLMVASLCLAVACGRYGPPVRSTPVAAPAAAGATPDPPAAPTADPSTPPAVPEPDFRLNLPETGDDDDDSE